VYGLDFLEKYPAYECKQPDGSWSTCDREEDICDKNLTAANWRIDYDADNSYFNWVDPS